MRSEDIAKLAGVSRSTVSRVINNYPNVPAATREKVLRIIEQHHYEPNSFARALAGKGTDTIGLFAISMNENEDESRIYQNSYFAPIVDIVVDTANAQGFYVLIHTIYSPDDFQKVKQAFQQKRIDGGILVGTQRDINFVSDMLGEGAPLVLIDYDITEIINERLDKDHLSIINSRDYEGTVEAIEYLINLGHQEIGIIKGRMSTFSGRERFLAYENTLKKHGLPIHDHFVLSGDFLKENAYREVVRMLDSGKLPTALFCSNDAMAISAMDALIQHGVTIPDDISIVGFDDALLASHVSPKLTSVRLPIDEMSRAAVEKIIELCQSGQSAFSTISFPTQLIVRDSCKSLSN
ncbi:LacI family DNA-binding transcriptional regulator [Paenibacillus segetis]|uniref:HTH-type transcriptional repressor ExuR n=1 Tax=Paenibacillus segetis TaxID=1325360 RepID=A0ABQ1Y8A8_9BACL|nr:LacI family DNA-binding transcriptional regulator [Paenibacillus segetis]GGH16455.1 putative HTH-type transcriptional repressor ExuR [Paenibacillus segetis]